MSHDWWYNPAKALNPIFVQIFSFMYLLQLLPSGHLSCMMGQLCHMTMSPEKLLHLLTFYGSREIR